VVRGFTASTFEWGDYVADALPEWLEDSGALVMVVVGDDDQPVGINRTALLSPTEAWMHAARVHPDLRRQGLGSMMNDYGVDWARRRGARVVRMVIEEWNQAPQRQVERLGWRPVSRWAHAHHGLEDDYVGESRWSPATAADAEAAFAAWSSGDLSTPARGLFPSGWWWRSLRPADLSDGAARGALFCHPTGWALAEPAGEECWINWLQTGPDEAGVFVSALAGLARGHQAQTLRAQIPRVEWLCSALTERGAALEPSIIYEKAL
jgi:GNAT superfamily N-acetyltransferase